MVRKFISIILCTVMLLCMSVPALATVNDPEPTESRTIEDILNEYHEKAFLAQTSTEPDSPSTYSRQATSDNNTLEQETVENLVSAGYEAYNVTSSNYNALEGELGTDFEGLGLDPNGSYIIVISGEDSGEVPNSNARVGSLPEQDIYDDGWNTNFTYTSNGTTYTMRYVTITSASESCLRMQTYYHLTNAQHYSQYIDDILSTIVSYMIDEASGKVPLGTILSLAGDWATDDNLTIMDDDDFLIIAGTTWTRNYIQIWNDATNAWHTAQCSAYASSTVKCTGLVYNSETNVYEDASGNAQLFTKYSAKYHNYTQRKADAVEAYLINTKFHDCTGDISFYLFNSTGDININGNSPLFTHHEPLQYLLPIIDY